MQFEISIYEDGDSVQADRKFEGSFALAVQVAATLIVQRFRKYVIAESSVKVETLYLSDTEWAATIQAATGDAELYGVTVQPANRITLPVM